MTFFRFTFAFGIPFFLFQFFDWVAFRIWCRQNNVAFPATRVHPFFDAHPQILFLAFRFPHNLKRALIAGLMGQGLVWLMLRFGR